MNVIEAIHKKRAVRVYTAQPIPEDVVRSILDAGRRSQSSKNTQPWQFVAVQDKARLKTLSTLGKYASHLADAALGVLLVAMPGNEFDLGQSAAYMQLAALEHGVGSCMIAIYEPEKARELLGISANWQVRYAIAFGYPAEEEQKKASKGRKKLEEVVHWERW
jgi:nitroreductase